VNSKVVAVCVFGVSLSLVKPVAAVCPAAVANPKTVICGIPGCSGSVTTYYCSGYGNANTCGGPCTGAITCCGIVVGYNYIHCSGLCAGCAPDDRALADARPTPGASPVAPVSAGWSEMRCAVEGKVTRANRGRRHTNAPLSPTATIAQASR
jgi:hypothetical protein